MGSRFSRILLPVDNSRYSDIGVELAMSLAREFGSELVGFDAYAAGLTGGRFDQPEVSLPAKYRAPGVLGSSG